MGTPLWKRLDSAVFARSGFAVMCNVPTRIIAQQYAIPSGSKRHCAWLRMVAHVVRNTVPNTAEQRRNGPPCAQYPPLHITEHHPKRPEPADPHRPPPRIRETRGTFRGHRRRPHHATPPGTRNPPQARRTTVGNRAGDAPHARHRRRTGRQRKPASEDIPTRRSGRAWRMRGGARRAQSFSADAEAIALNALNALITLVFSSLGHSSPCCRHGGK